MNPSLHKDEEEAPSSAGAFHLEKNNQPLAGAIKFGRTCFHGDQMQLTVEHDFHG